MLQQKLMNAQVIEKKPYDDTETLKVTVFIFCVCMLTCFYNVLTKDFSKFNHAINTYIFSIYNHGNHGVESEKMTLFCCSSEDIHSPPQLLNK